MRRGRTRTASYALALVMIGCSSGAGGGGAGGASAPASGGAGDVPDMGVMRGSFPDADPLAGGDGGTPGTGQGGSGGEVVGPGAGGGSVAGSGGGGPGGGPADAGMSADGRRTDGPPADVNTRSGSCFNPVMIPSDVSHADVAVTTAGGAHAFDLPCVAGDAQVVLSFTLTQRELVYADTFGSSWNTVLYFSSDCAPTPPSADLGTVACSDDACGGQQSQAVAVLGYGRHYLVLGGVGGATGSATVHFQHVPVGNGPLTLLPQGAGTRTGTTSGNGLVNDCEAAGPDDSYWWRTCPDYAGGMLTASTCHGAEFDTVLSVQIPRGDVSSCGDDDPMCGIQSSVSAAVPPGAGIQVLTVDSNTGSNHGPYTLTFTRP